MITTSDMTIEPTSLRARDGMRNRTRGAIPAALACLLAVLPACAIAQSGIADGTFPPPAIAACDASHAIVLESARTKTTDARAYWIDRSRLQWPGAPGDGRFRLYHAALPSLLAEPGTQVTGADGALDLVAASRPLPEALARRYAFIGEGPLLALQPDDVARMPDFLTGQLLLVREDDDGRVLDATSLQSPGALDDLYAEAARIDDLGAQVRGDATAFTLWAPTARGVWLCGYRDGSARARALHPMLRDARTGAWCASLPPDSARSWLGDLAGDALEAGGGDAVRAPATVRAQTGTGSCELHVRAFSIGDASVAAAHRGKYMAFAASGSNGMR